MEKWCTGGQMPHFRTMARSRAGWDWHRDQRKEATDNHEDEGIFDEIP